MPIKAKQDDYSTNSDIALIIKQRKIIFGQVCSACFYATFSSVSDRGFTKRKKDQLTKTENCSLCVATPDMD